MLMKKLFVVLLAMCTMTALQAQKIKGDASCLKGQKEVNVQFIYKGVTYGGDSEDKYLKDEDKAKEPEWKKAWTSTFRTEKWEPRLVEDLNKELAKTGMKCGDFPKAEYTVLVKFTDIYPGTFAGPMSVPARITCVVSFVKTGSTDAFATLNLYNIAYKYFMSPMPEQRVGEAMSCVGEVIGKQMSKIK